jgi:hypothetical protein
VIGAIRADPVLTERQKSVLIDIYAALRKEAQAADRAPTAATGDTAPTGPGSDTASPDVAVATPTPTRMSAGVPSTDAGIEPMPEGEQDEDR